MSDAPPPADLDLRLVRYFTVVADHRHFGRAAAALLIAQPSLSRQIRRLEQQLGVRLLDRTPHGTQLTEAGEVFLPRAKALLRSAAQAAAAARAAAQPSRITIGYTVSIIVTPAVRDLRRRHPDADVHTLHLDWNEPREALLGHRVVDPPGATARRQSMAYFQNANWSAQISCLPTCLEPGEQPRYAPVLAGPHLMGKFRRSVSL